MGESDRDRIGLLHQLSTLNPHPESVPINLLARVEGTALGHAEPLDPFILVRTIATARIVMPASRVGLSAGRRPLSREPSALCVMAGAHWLFLGARSLTVPKPSRDEDDQLRTD